MQRDLADGQASKVIALNHLSFLSILFIHILGAAVNKRWGSTNIDIIALNAFFEIFLFCTPSTFLYNCGPSQNDIDSMYVVV